MTGSKENSGSRSRLPTAPPSGAPSPAVTTVHAAGESTFPGESRPSSTPVRNTSTASLATPVTRTSSSSSSLSSLGSSLTLPHDRCSASNDSDDYGKPGSRTSWFSRKGTWPRAVRKSRSVAEAAQKNISTKRADSPGETARAETIEPQSRMLKAGKSGTTLSAEYVQSSPSTTSLSRPLRMKPAPPTVAPPLQTPAPAPDPVPEPPVQERENTPVEPLKGDAAETTPDNTSSTQNPGTWLGWWYRQPAQPELAVLESTDVKESTPAEGPMEESTKEPEEQLQLKPSPEYLVDQQNKMNIAKAVDGAAGSVESARPWTWYGLWGSSHEEILPIVGVKAVEETSSDVPLSEPTSVAESQTALANTSTTDAQQLNITSTSGGQPSKGYGYGWSFWSTPADASGTEELAVAGVLSESNPQKANLKQLDTAPASIKQSFAVSFLQVDSSPQTPKPSKSKPAIKAAPSKSKDAPSKSDGTTPHSLQPSSTTLLLADPSAAKKNLQKILPQNHLLPAFDTCYRLPDQPSMLQQLSKIFRHAPLSKDHLYISKQAPRVKKAVAIGVHGFFPMRLVRTVLGEPTGTSIRFANHAASSIKRWAEKNDVEVEVEKIALEGEGKVADRVEMLWKLLQNWMEHVRSADFVLLAAHSQGVVVGIELLARLIEEGCVDNARIGFTAMAGINLGPFGHLPTTLLTGSARELFEFQKPESTVSKKYVEALRIVLAHNVRILYVGSIDDQLVPLESSTMTNISHPYIYRAVFVDGRVHAPDFLSHLVGFAMKLRNLGASDHGLIRELSSPLAGSLYGGEGHSRIYDDGAVYDLGVRHALETMSCEGIPLRVEPFELPNNANPYFLPWSLRGMLEETIVRNQLAAECGHLLEQFENWKPTLKSLKDVKFRLEGIRSKL